MVWSYFNQSKRKQLSGSIANPAANPAAGSAPGRSPGLANAQPQDIDAFFLPDFTDNRTLLELLISSNILALILALIEAKSAIHISIGSLTQFAFFTNWVTVSFAWLIDAARGPLRRLPRLAALLLSVALLEVIVTLTTVACNLGLNWVLGSQYPWWWRLDYHLVLGAALGLVIMRYLYVREQMIKQHRAELLSRVQALQARIRPHFLFNTINSVLSLIALDPRKAEQMVENLSHLFRVSLSSGGQITLLDEVALCRRYLAIEAIRLGERLQVDWQLPDEDELYEVNIPSLTLQPLLENAIYHGVEGFARPSVITVLIQVSVKDVTIVVTNPCQAGKNEGRVGNGMALDNIQQRLQAYYGAQSRVRTHQTGQLFTAYVNYPVLPQ